MLAQAAPPVAAAATAAAPAAPTDSTEDHQVKRTRYSAEPDLKVVVGTGEQQQEFLVHAKYFRSCAPSTFANC
eukprot:scaffold34379_cov54-Phaeocystis_antarctica.AAC.1